jgi:hypothetical protein
MKQTYFTQQNMDQARCSLMTFIGAVILVGSGVVLMLAYFDVLVK